MLKVPLLALSLIPLGFVYYISMVFYLVCATQSLLLGLILVVFREPPSNCNILKVVLYDPLQPIVLMTFKPGPSHLCTRHSLPLCQA
jgi:hypothetical protein